MHVRSLMTIDPYIPSMPGRITSSCHRPGKHCLHRAHGAVRCWASRIKGELHPTRTFEAVFLENGDQCQVIDVFIWCGHFQRKQWVSYVTPSWVPYHLNATCNDHPPCAKFRFSMHKNDLTRPPAMVTADKTETVPWLSSPRSERRDLQCRRDPSIYIDQSLGVCIFPYFVEKTPLEFRLRVCVCQGVSR